MHNIYDYLQKEFQKIQDLFKKFEEDTDIKTQNETFILIKNELSLLEKSEKATFYKMLEEHGKTRLAAELSEQGFLNINKKVEEM
jgi:hemerythrin-like domain-containing protein